MKIIENQSIENWTSYENSINGTSVSSSEKKIDNCAQNDRKRTKDGLDDIMRAKVLKYLKDGKSLKCHYRNCNDKEFFTLEEYLSHSLRHKFPLYPDLNMIELHKEYDMVTRGNPWEDPMT